MDFSERIRELRAETGLSYTQFASKFDKSEGAIRAWETGRSKPDADTLIKLSDYFKVPTDYLLGLTDARRPENTVLVNELGLSDEAIKKIKADKDVYYGGIFACASDVKTDSRKIIDVFNSFIESYLFFRILSRLGAVTDSTIDEWDNLIPPGDLDGEGYTANEFFRNGLHNDIDRLIEVLKAEYQK